MSVSGTYLVGDGLGVSYQDTVLNIVFLLFMYRLAVLTPTVTTQGLAFRRSIYVNTAVI